MKTLRTILALLIVSLPLRIFAQDYPEVKLADEYFHKNDFEKAKDAYETVVRKKISINYIYENYRTTLYALEDYKAFDKLLKNLLKTQPSNIVYQIDLGILRDDQGKKSESDKIFSKVINSSKDHSMKTNLCATHFLKRNLPQQSVNTYLKARNSSGKYAFARELSQVYLISGQKQNMIDELLNLLADAEGNLEYVQNTLQENLDADEFEILEKKLFDKIQGQFSSIVYNKLLIWYYVQKKDFYSAFIQAKAVDKRLGTPDRKGGTLMELGQIAMENRDYENAILCFEHISENYPKSYYYHQSKRLLIESKEEIVKTKFPIPDVEIKKLIDDYMQLKKQIRDPNENVKIIRSVARLYSFYLGDHDTAMNLLNDVLQHGRNDKNLEAECKILLGDIYLLKNEPWESTLLYSQAEKSVKDSPIAHLAKLKNAQLSFYRGDFELAQAHLNVLKLATSREISNDAIDLSLLISDNLNLDTSSTAMEEYASIDLLVFQHKFIEAQSGLDAMLKKFVGHSLTDEIYWKKAEIFKKVGQIDSSIIYLEKIVTEFPDDILGDNSLFELAEIYQFKKRDSAKAMELYKQLLMDFPGSIYTAEARKRFRKLRGDAIFQESSEEVKPHIH